MASFSEQEWNVQYHKSDDEDKVRTVGLEIETKVKNQSSIFYDFEYNNARNRNLVEADERIRAELKKFPIANWGRDGADKEFVLHPDSITLFKRGGSARLRQVFKYLKENCKPATASGTHIHISILPGEDINKTWDNIYWFQLTCAEQMQKIFGRTSHWAQDPIYSTINNIARDHKIAMYDISAEVISVNQDEMKDYTHKIYSGKNMMVQPHGNRWFRDYDDKGTIHDVSTFEFRGPKSTVNIEEVLAWVEFCHNIVDLCSQGPIDNRRFSEFLKGTHISRYVNSLKRTKERTITLTEMRQIIGKKAKVTFKPGERILK